jgi:hypothetical protein
MSARWEPNLAGRVVAMTGAAPGPGEATQSGHAIRRCDQHRREPSRGRDGSAPCGTIEFARRELAG